MRPRCARWHRQLWIKRKNHFVVLVFIVGEKKKASPSALWMFTALICTRADRMALTLLHSCRADLIKLHTLSGENNFTKKEKCLRL